MNRQEYNCEHCHDTGWTNFKRLEDGTELKCLCYCHPLVRSGKLKALAGSWEFDKYMKERKGKYR